MSALENAEATAYRASVRADIAEMSSWLLENLGQRITSVALGLSDASVVRRYARGEAKPRDDREARLRLLYRVGRMIADVYDAETARAFLVGSNPQLDDISPVVAIAEGDPHRSGAAVIAAARALTHE